MVINLNSNGSFSKLGYPGNDRDVQRLLTICLNLLPYVDDPNPDTLAGPLHEVGSSFWADANELESNFSNGII